MIPIEYMSFQELWDNFALHTWLLFSSYGIIFAVLSFFEDMGSLGDIKNNKPWVKGILAIFIGILFYLIIGLRHLHGAKRRLE